MNNTTHSAPSGQTPGVFAAKSTGRAGTEWATARSGRSSAAYSRFLRDVALPCVSLVTQSRFWDLYGKMSKGGHQPLFSPTPEEKLARIRRLVQHAYHEVPFYRERMARLGIGPGFPASLDDFRQLPPVTKSDIAANFPDRVTARSQRYQPWRYVSTSGTLERLMAIHDFRKRDLVRASGLLSLNCTTGYQPGMRYLEIPPNVCRNVCGQSDEIEPGVLTFLWRNLKSGQLRDPETISDMRGLVERQLLYRKLVLPSYGADGIVESEEKTSWYIRQIDGHQPYVVKALPIYLYLLGLHLLEGKSAPPRIERAVMPMGSSMTAGMKSVIEASFGVHVVEDYGCAEFGGVAAECDGQPGLKPFHGLFHVEIVRDNRPAESGDLGRVIITDLDNYAMPMIRYDIGDVASWTRSSGGSRMEVLGRVRDCIVREDGRILTPDEITDAVLQQSNVVTFQMEYRDERRVHVRLVPRNGAAPPVAATKEMLDALLGPNHRISVRIVPTILPEQGGKYRFVKNLRQAVPEV